MVGTMVAPLTRNGDFDERANLSLQPIDLTDYVPVDEWPKEIEEQVLLYVVHENAKYEADAIKRQQEWEAWCVGYWTDFNGGGWVWHGLCGVVTHVSTLPDRPPPPHRSNGG